MAYKYITSNAGHSAKSPGAEASGYKEHEQARKLNEAFIKAMRKRGVEVTDVTSNARNKAAVLQEQVAKANKIGGGKSQLNVSFHLNAGGGTGVEVLHYGSSTKDVATKVSAAIARVLGIRNRGNKQRQDLFFLRKTTSPAILIETCFIDSELDMESLVGKYDQVADAIATVITGKSVPTEVRKKHYDGDSIVDGLKTAKIDSSFANRSKLAVEYGVVHSASQYKGTSSQNSSR